jgi:hypothetical protein
MPISRFFYYGRSVRIVALSGQSNEREVKSALASLDIVYNFFVTLENEYNYSSNSLGKGTLLISVCKLYKWARPLLAFALP